MKSGAPTRSQKSDDYGTVVFLLLDPLNATLKNIAMPTWEKAIFCFGGPKMPRNWPSNDWTIDSWKHFHSFPTLESSPASVTCSLSSGFSSATTWEFLATNNDDDNCMVESPGCQQRQHQKKEESRPTHTASSWQIRRLQIPIDIRWEVIPQKLTKGIVPVKKKESCDAAPTISWEIII